MLGLIGDTFDVGPDAAGWVATGAQLGTACGILLLVPMTDIVRPRLQIEVQAVIACVALLGAAVAPHLVLLCVAIFVTGFVSNIAQVVMPLAVRTAPQGTLARTMGTLAGSLLVGIFGGRIAAGLIAEHFGWRAVFAGTAAMVLLMVPLLRAVVHSSVTAASHASYPRLLRSLPATARANQGVRLSAATQFFVFAAFNGVWTVIALYLTSDDVGWTAAQAGMTGLVGLLAGVVTSFTGRLIAKVGPVAVLAPALALTLAGTTIIMLGSPVLVLVIVALFALTVGTQAAMIANQNRALAGMREAAGRANTVYMFGAFLGGSGGAAVAAFAYSAGGIGAAAACATTAVLAACAITGGSVWRSRRVAASRRR
jgi:predicted MFS family arabinose efflux permease